MSSKLSMDKISISSRSENMRKIRSKDTKPELIVRKLIFNEGFRYRLHSKLIPGKPDITFPSKKKVIFINGCFWHQHNIKNCNNSHLPKSNLEYWIPKLEKTVQRDLKNQSELKKLGYSILILWECELDDSKLLLKKIKYFLNKKS